jgi:hypothetical protein
MRVLLTVICSVVFCCAASIGHAQEASKPQTEEPSKEVQKKPAQPAIPCHLEFALNEMQDGKKINTRHYSMDLNVGNQDQIKTETKVPVQVSDNAFQTMDIGTSIWASLDERQDVIILRVSAEITNFASPNETAHPGARPIVRQLSLHGSTAPTLGKAVSIATLDDPNSDHQFQLEVTVTKLN